MFRARALGFGFPELWLSELCVVRFEGLGFLASGFHQDQVRAVMLGGLRCLVWEG